MLGSGRTRYELAALIGVSLLSLLVLAPPLAPLRSLALGLTPLGYSSYDFVALGLAYLCAVVMTLLAQRTIDYYLLLQKREQKLSRALLVLTFFALLLRMPWQLWGVPLGYLVGLAYMLGTYQQQHRASLYLALGLGLGSLSLYSAKTLFILPLLWVLMYQQRTLAPKHFFALLHGVVLAIFFAFAAWGVADSLSFARGWLEQWTQWQAIPWGWGGSYALYAWGAFALLALLYLSLVVFVSSSTYSSVRHSAQMQSLVTMLFLGLGLWSFDASTPMLFACLLPLPIVVLVSQGIAQLHQLRHQRWATLSLMALLFIILFLS